VAVDLLQRIGDARLERAVHFNIGRAYASLPDIYDLNAAEAAFQRSLALCDPSDALWQFKCIQSIGVVHHSRFRDARKNGEPSEVQRKHRQAAESQYQQALKLCPASATAELGPLFGQLGNFYGETGQHERALKQYEKAVHYFEQTGDRHHAGLTRVHVAMWYVKAASEAPPANQRDVLLRARAYAQAALRDFQHYDGREAEEEAKVQRLLDNIVQLLAAGRSVVMRSPSNELDREPRSN
jgi:tetratricopeptide (TPR) repeat protein